MRQGALSPFISVPDTIDELLAVGASVPIANSGRVHVVGRNDMASPQKMGCTWVVRDPDGVVVEEQTDDWAGWPYPTDVNPNDTHEFISRTRFDLNKAGTWTISMALLMNYDDLQAWKQYLEGESPAVIPTEPSPPNPKEDLEFVADSPEYLAYTIEDIGYREKLDTAFQTAIARAKGG